MSVISQSDNQGFEPLGRLEVVMLLTSHCDAQRSIENETRACPGGTDGRRWSSRRDDSQEKLATTPGVP